MILTRMKIALVEVISYIRIVMGRIMTHKIMSFLSHIECGINFSRNPGVNRSGISFTNNAFL